MLGISKESNTLLLRITDMKDEIQIEIVKIFFNYKRLSSTSFLIDTIFVINILLSQKLKLY